MVRGISCSNKPVSHHSAPLLYNLVKMLATSLLALVSKESLWLEGTVFILGIFSLSGSSRVKRRDRRLFETGIPDPESRFSLLGHIRSVFQ